MQNRVECPISATKKLTSVLSMIITLDENNKKKNLKAVSRC